MNDPVRCRGCDTVVALRVNGQGGDHVAGCECKTVDLEAPDEPGITLEDILAGVEDWTAGDGRPVDLPTTVDGIVDDALDQEADR